MSTTLDIGRKLVALCNQGKAMEAIDTLYAPGVVSIEAVAAGPIAQRIEGFAGVRGKTEWWEQNHQTHATTAEGPWPHGDRFIVHFTFDVTPTTGPFAGKRMKLDEAALYTVKEGKIVQEEFFYDMGG